MPRLTLSRFAGESITIGGSVVVTVVEIGTRRAVVTVEAPADVRIVRTELIPGGPSPVPKPPPNPNLRRPRR